MNKANDTRKISWVNCEIPGHGSADLWFYADLLMLRQRSHIPFIFTTLRHKPTSIDADGMLSVVFRDLATDWQCHQYCSGYHWNAAVTGLATEVMMAVGKLLSAVISNRRH